jgi:hypothetical protein
VIRDTDPGKSRTSPRSVIRDTESLFVDVRERVARFVEGGRFMNPHYAWFIARIERGGLSCSPVRKFSQRYPKKYRDGWGKV